MVDDRFHATAPPMSLDEIAELTGATRVPGGTATQSFLAVAPLALAGPREVSFLDGARNLAAYEASDAGAFFVPHDLLAELDASRNLLATEAPNASYVQLARHLHPEPPVQPGIHPTAHIGPSAELGAGVEIGPGAVISERAAIGAGTVIGAGSLVGPGVVIGPDCRIAPHVTVSHALLGARVRLAPGARIGQAGFGFLPGPAGLEPIPQLGRVVIEDDVDIGANTTIDRGSGEDTVIGHGTKIDNLVQIAHNCRIGAHCIIVSQVGMSGSVTVGDGAMLAGKVGIADHLSIGAGARVAAKSGVSRNIPPGATYGGYPAKEIRDWHRETTILSRLRKRGKRSPE